MIYDESIFVMIVGDSDLLVELLSRLRSPYLLSLIDYSESNHKLLVYEFMANGGLQEHLYPITDSTVMVKRFQRKRESPSVEVSLTTKKSILGLSFSIILKCRSSIKPTRQLKATDEQHKRGSRRSQKRQRWQP
ncbi:hypothetical protein M9H77_30580 [Catharanthus roseus]|uniref:Uncharacterized protein n=1 Tax=Catharanthus roseus TaxID=4058 RepID=A0ACC0A1Y0_CATRO|nr:hypothetical protein M9H77_30580 [Catharanthus roseus]